jgi:hypothetical protein
MGLIGAGLGVVIGYATMWLIGAEIGIGYATILLIVAGLAVVFGAIWRNTILIEKLLLLLTKWNIKIESIISLIRKQPKDPWYIKLFKLILGVIIIKTISQFILLPIVNWCWDIIITNLGNIVTPNIQEILDWLSKIDFTQKKVEILPH